MTPEERAVVDAALYLRYCIDAKTAGDPPRIGRLLDAVDQLIYSCPQCNAGGHVCPGDGNGISHTATDCGQHRDECDNCAPLAAGASITRVDGTEAHQACTVCGSPAYALIGPDWTPATWAMVQVGDVVRLPGREETRAEVESVQTIDWHSKLVWSKRVEDYPNGAQQWRNKVEPHEHMKVHVCLRGRTDLLSFDPTQEVEILMDAHRRAEHLLQLTFHAERVD